MNHMSRIIYHVPFVLDYNAMSASGIRPCKMLEAFQSIGFEVDVVAGNAKERKIRIKQIEQNISNGIKYDFCYSESSTQPTLHTEPYLFLKHPFFEFKFFSFLKKHDVKIGLFYRDIYWCFTEYADSLKKKFYKVLYRYDLRQYSRYVDVLFVPSLEMMEYVTPKIDLKLDELPPGTDIKFTNKTNDADDSDMIEMFYVGGIGNHYDLKLLIKVLRDYPHIHFTLCCRESDWAKVKYKYSPLISDNVTIVHESGAELEKYYADADICSLFVAPEVYRAFAMPYKLLEFIGHGLPVLASSGTKTAEFVSKNDCGYSIEYDESTLRIFFDGLTREKLIKTRRKVMVFAPSQTWEARASQVANTLS